MCGWRSMERVLHSWINCVAIDAPPLPVNRTSYVFFPTQLVPFISSSSTIPNAPLPNSLPVACKSWMMSSAYCSSKKRRAMSSFGESYSESALLTVDGGSLVVHSQHSVLVTGSLSCRVDVVPRPGTSPHVSAFRGGSGHETSSIAYREPTTLSLVWRRLMQYWLNLPLSRG